MIKIRFVVPSNIDYIGGIKKTIKRNLLYDTDNI